MNYPLRIRFWYLAHDLSERVWHWIWRTKLEPWHAADRASRPPVPPRFTLIETREPDEYDRAHGVTAYEIYSSSR